MPDVVDEDAVALDDRPFKLFVDVELVELLMPLYIFEYELLDDDEDAVDDDEATYDVVAFVSRLVLLLLLKWELLLFVFLFLGFCTWLTFSGLKVVIFLGLGLD